MSDIFSNSECKRDVPSFIEPRPPLITNPFMRRRPQKGTNLMDLFEEESTYDEPELVQVYLRLKPCTIPSNLYEVRGDRYLITSLDTTTAGHGRKTQHNVSKMYTFSHIFPEDISQKEIFDHVVKDNLKKLPEGRSFTLLTYGASGSGKTYTLMGTVASPGLVPRSLEYLFNNVEVQMHPVYKPAEGGFDPLSCSSQEYELLFVKRLRKLSAPLRDKYRRMSSQLRTDLRGSVLDLSKSKHYIWVSFIEIYNEGIYDLLAGSDRRAAKLVIREDLNGNVYVKGATQAFVRSGEEAYDVMVAGKHNLQVAATGVHAQSSRSHCIFTITMLTENDGGIVTSCVRLCDLAGSERARRTRNTGARMQESRAINTSLHVLERCLHSLRRKQAVANRAVVPYRESKLTRLLGAGLSGTRGESVTMVVTLNPSPEYAHETRHVLQLAAVAKDLQINNTVSDYPSSLESSTHDLNNSVCAELMKLRSCNERLNFELLQCQNYNKELTALIDEKQATNAVTMQEIVNLAKEGSRQFYEPQIEALKREIEELKEEYEELISDLKEQMVGPKGIKIDELMTEVATLKEKITAEELARARAEEEIQHLRACIEERDGNDEVSNEHISITESDSEEEQDELCNESLEPTFKKEDINRTRLLRQSLVMDDDNGTDNVSDLDDTLKDDSVESNENVMTTCKKKISHDLDNEECNLDLVSFKMGNKGSFFFNDDNVIPEKTDVRGTYCVTSNDQSNKAIESSIDEGFQCDDEVDDVPEILVKKSSSLPKKVTGIKYKTRNDSLAQFEQFELESNNCNPAESLSPNEFGNNLPCNTKGFFYDSETHSELVKINIDDERSPSIVQDDVNDNYEPSMIKKILKKKFVALHEKPGNFNANQDTIKGNEETEFKESFDCEIPEHAFEASHESVDLFESPRPGNTEIVLSDKHNEPKDNINSLEIPKNLRAKSQESSINKTIPSFPPLGKDNINESETDNIRKLSTVVSHVGEVTANDSEKENIIETTDEKELKDRKSLSMLIERSELSTVDVSHVGEVLANDSEKENIIETTDEKELKDRKSLSMLIETSELSTVDVSHVGEVSANDSEKENIVIETKDEKELKDRKSLSMLIERSELSTVDVSHVGEVLANDSEKENIIETTDEKELKDRKSLSMLIETSREIETTTKPNILEDEIKTESPSSINDASLNVNSLPKPSDLFKVPLPLNDNTKLEKVTEKNKEGSKYDNDCNEKISNDISITNVTINNTLDAFEDIYKNITLPRVTEFDLLVSTAEEKAAPPETETKYNLRQKSKKTRTQHIKEEKLQLENNKNDQEEIKKLKVNDEMVFESQVKCESKPKRNLRLRRRNEESELKFKNIANLQAEFSDVTMNLPAPTKLVEDIPSPIKDDEENISPVLGMQSCPSKSVTRSRRKLFTPRAEALEETCPQTIDIGEQIRVPRPSYHRPRARRKL
ncbi:kinesin-like protein KIF20B [Pieris brassicae]|uniref:kinesin-like protein KIF20B n=1 Tax=Pieris brassicae TaxID=7116 RepID=UPI001E66066D|nr:kinesin-like protein KIF20B [Pieris brassicae]